LSRAHGLRRTYAAQFRAEGVDIAIISRQLGHASITTTARYLDHLAPVRSSKPCAVELGRERRLTLLTSKPDASVLTCCFARYAHRLRAIGHLHEAEDESQAVPDLHAAIRAARRAYQTDGTIPAWASLESLIGEEHPAE
jgi:hypothetical protein